jgi:hypothetical protein
MLQALIVGFFIIAAYCAMWIAIGVWEFFRAFIRALTGGRVRMGGAPMGGGGA